MAVLGEGVSKKLRSEGYAEARPIELETVAEPVTSDEIEIPLAILEFLHKNPEYNYFFSLEIEQGDELEFEKLRKKNVDSNGIIELNEKNKLREQNKLLDKDKLQEKDKLFDKDQLLEKDKLLDKEKSDEKESLESFDTYEPQFEQIDQEYEKLKQALFSDEIFLDLEIDLNSSPKSNSLTFSGKSAPKLSKEEESYINYYQLFQTPAVPGSTLVYSSVENSSLSNGPGSLSLSEGSISEVSGTSAPSFLSLLKSSSSDTSRTSSLLNSSKQSNTLKQPSHFQIVSVNNLTNQKPKQIDQLEHLKRLAPTKPNWTRYIQKNSKKEFPIKKSFFIDKLSKKIWKLLITEIEAYRKIYEILEKEKSNPEIEFFLEAMKNALICTFEQQKTELLSLLSYNFISAKPKKHLKFSETIVERMIFSFESESVNLVLVEDKDLSVFNELQSHFTNLGNELRLQMRWFPLSPRMYRKVEETMNKVDGILKTLSSAPKPA